MRRRQAVEREQIHAIDETWNKNLATAEDYNCRVDSPGLEVNTSYY